MAEGTAEIETPKKFSSRNPLCRLCCEATESRHMVKVFGKAGVSQELASKIESTCAVSLRESDYKLNSVCRKCINFVNKMYDFVKKTRSVNQTIYLQPTDVSVKRCIDVSPSSCQQTKRKSTTQVTAKELFPPSQTAKANDDPMSQDEVVPIMDGEHNSTAVNEATLTITQQRMLVSAVNSRDAAVVVMILHDYCTNVVKELNGLRFKDIESSCAKLCKRKGGSVLHGHDYESLENFNFVDIWNELLVNFPFIVSVMNALSGKTSDQREELRVKYAFIYSILMGERWHELSLVKRVNTIIVIEGGCSKQLQERLNKPGVCLSHGTRDTLLKLLGGHFSDVVVRKIKDGKVFRGTGDNWDLKILRSHMRLELKNEDLHLFASNLIQNRNSFNHLPNDKPKGDIKKLPRSVFSLNLNETRQYAYTAKVLVARICLEFFPKFKFLSEVIPEHLPHEYCKEMTKKSTIVSMPIINADESQYEDCVEILRTYENWIAEIYVKAGMLQDMPQVYNPPLTSNQAAPGQTNAHQPDTADDPMLEMKIAFAGDQLTPVRFAGAKDLLSGSHTPSDQFEHCSPFKPVMWHTKASLLPYSYSFLYKAESVNQVGTLKYFREKYSRRNVTPAKVLDAYEGCEELFLSVGRAYIVVAAMKCFGMENRESKPTKYPFPADMSSTENKQTYFDDALGKFIDKFLLQKASVFCYDDYVMNYALCFIFLSILMMQMKDAAAGDGSRNLIHQKLLLTVFKSMSAYSKYAIEMFVSIAQIECLLTPILSEEFKWGFFVNWRGGTGKNIEDDLAQEISNRCSKSIVQRMGPNKTINSISKVCKAATGIKQVTEKFDSSTGIHKKSVQHSTPDYLEDEKGMIDELLLLDPFEYEADRCHDNFPEIKRCLVKYLNIVEFHEWLDKHKKELST